MTPRRVVLIGYGMAGARLAEEVRRRDPHGERVSLTAIGAEPYPAYNRVLLSSMVNGSLTGDQVWLQDCHWAAGHSVGLRTGCSVVGIDRVSRTVELSDGGSLPYDALVLATGSSAWLPPTEGLRVGSGLAPGVVAFRTLDDCKRILAAARPGAPVAVLGGGLLGLEAARGLTSRGSLVTVVHPAGHLMERQLDPGAGQVLGRTMARLGVEVRLGVFADRYVAGDGLVLSDGSRVPADLVVVSAGARAETGLAVRAGLLVHPAGITVDDSLRTSDPRVYAIGDCARHTGAEAGFVQPAWEQAVVLANLLTGADPAARYRGTAAVTRLKARDVDLTTLGDTHVEVDAADAEVLCLQDPVRGHYAKLVLRDERVVGAILLGAPGAAAAIVQLFDRGAAVPSDRVGLLLGRGIPVAVPADPAGLPATATVCRCNTVSKRQLVVAWRAGARSVDELAEVTRATTGCGGCTEAVCTLSAWLAEAAVSERPLAESLT